MPGRLAMDLQDHSPSDGASKESTAASKDMSSHISSDMPVIPGLATSIPTSGAALSNGHSTHGVNPSNGGSPTQSSTPRLPPELEHYIDSYVPFGKLLERMAQQAYCDLGEVVDSMADMPVQRPASTNGVSSPGGVNTTTDTSATSIEKKLRLMNYAQNQKDRFIKALVLTDWSRNMDSMNRLIELTMWLRRQDEMTQSATDGMLRLKHNMIAAKMPNPNIEGALELLSTGKAAWMPDLGYLPVKPLTSRKILDTLQEMNFALSIRINLHEDLPPHFREYSIANGRATFVVPGEFEVDLAVADEDPESPFYFIDIRLLFSPASAFPDRGLRNQLEGKVNDILAAGGLQACYTFLHGFILTHKVNVLRWQAAEMARNKWCEHIDSQMVHRSLILQYWTGQPGGRNWIEFGIASSTVRSNVPRISCRWFRRSQEIPDVDFLFNYEHLSLESMLEQIVAQHSSGRLGVLKEQLQLLATTSSALHVQLSTSNSDPGECSLEIRLDPAATSITVSIEPVTGKLIVSPRTALSADIEERLNVDAAVEPAQLTSYLICKLLQDQITKQASRLGWSPARVVKPRSLKTVFQDEPVRWSIFKRNSWAQRWALAATVSLQGVKWWVVLLANDSEPPNIIHAESLFAPHTTPRTFDRASLLSIEHHAVTKISLSSVSQELRKADISHRMLRTPGSEVGGDVTLYIDSESLLGKGRDSSSRPWCSGPLKLTHLGLEDLGDGHGKASCVLKTSLSPTAARRLSLLVDKRQEAQSGISFQGSGALELLLQTPLGEPLLPQIRSRLSSVERLSSYVHVMKSQRFTSTYIGLDRLAFGYTSDLPLYAELIFPTTTQTGVQLRLYSEQDGVQSIVNPTYRIHAALQAMLGSKTQPGQEARVFNTFCQLLTGTLPLLRTLAAIEAKDPYYAATFLCRSASSYKLIYRRVAGSPTFLIKLSVKDGVAFWHVEDARRGPSRSEQLTDKLKAVWESRGGAWEGLENGAFASVQGVEDLLGRLDAVVRGFEEVEEEEEEEEEAPVPFVAEHVPAKTRKNVETEIVVID